MVLLLTSLNYIDVIERIANTSLSYVGIVLHYCVLQLWFVNVIIMRFVRQLSLTGRKLSSPKLARWKRRPAMLQTAVYLMPESRPNIVHDVCSEPMLQWRVYLCKSCTSTSDNVKYRSKGNIKMHMPTMTTMPTMMS